MAAMENSMTPTKVRWKEPSPVTYGKVEVKQVEHSVVPAGLERIHSFGSESELDIHLASSRAKRAAGVPRGVLVSSSAAIMSSDGNITPRDIEKAVKTRARPRKEFEGTPFLSIDNISPGTVLARAEEEAAKRKNRKLRNALHSYGQRIPSSLGESLEASFGIPPPPPSSPRMTNGWGQRSRSPMRKESVPRAKTPGSKRQSASKPDRMASGVSRTSTRCTSVMSGQQVVYRSPNSNPRKPPHNIKAPFKQGPLPDIESLQERPLSPSEELKECTARGVHRVKKALLREPSPEPVRSGGRLLKAKLKPLYPVTQLRGPTIGQCRGVLAERYEQEETMGKLKNRKAELLEQLRARQLIPESIHLTSEASEVTDSEDEDDNDDDEEAVKQLDDFQDSDEDEDDEIVDDNDDDDNDDDIGPSGHPPITPPPPCSPTDEAADFDFPVVNGQVPPDDGEKTNETKTEEEEKPDSGKENRKKPQKKDRCKENNEKKDRRKEDDDEEGEGGGSGRKNSGGPKATRTGPNSVSRKETTSTKPNNAAKDGAKQTKTRKQSRGKRVHGPVSSKASKRSPRNPKSAGMAWELKRIRQLKCGICGTFTYNMVDFGETTGYCVCEKCHENNGQPVTQDSPVEEPREDTKRKKRRVRFVDDKPNPELEVMKDKWSRLDEDIMKSLETLTSLKCYRDSGEQVQRHKDDNDGPKDKCNISSEEESDEEYFSADSDFEDEPGYERTKMAMPDLSEFKGTKVAGSDSGQGSDVSSEQGTVGSEAGSDVGQVDVKVEYTVKQKKRPKTSNVRPQDVEMICREVRKLLANAWGQETLKNLEETPPKPKRKTTTVTVKEKPAPVTQTPRVVPASTFPPLCFQINALPPPGHLFYFAYGADMNPDRMATYLGSEIEERRWGLLYGFDILFNKKGFDKAAGSFPNIEFNPLRSVEGCVYVMTQDQLSILDSHMGYPQHYAKAVLPVWVSNCADPTALGVAQYCVPAVMYIAQDEWTEEAVPTDCSYSVGQCLQGGDLLTPGYIRHLEQLQAPRVAASVA